METTIWGVYGCNGKEMESRSWVYGDYSVGGGGDWENGRKI